MTLIARGARSVPVTVQQRAAATPERMSAIAMSVDPAAVFHAIGPLPGVVRVDDQTGSWDEAGRTRTLVLTDGTTATERLIEVTPPSSYAYESTGFTNLLGLLASGVRAEWTFTPDAGGTLVRWTYEFLPLPGRRLVVAGLLAPAWRGYMRRGLDAVIAEIDRPRV